MKNDIEYRISVILVVMAEDTFPSRENTFSALKKANLGEDITSSKIINLDKCLNLLS